MAEFKLPDVGEGLTEAEIVTWKVKEGDTVAINQVLVEMETAKSLVELPSPFAGLVQKLLVPEGETVPVGTPIIAIGDGSEVEAPDPAAAPESASVEIDLSNPAASGSAEGESLVGRMKADRGAVRRARKIAASAQTQAAFEPGGASTSIDLDDEDESDGPLVPATSAAPTEAGNVRVLAKPPVRKLAQDLGVDLASLVGSGPNGIVTRDDVQAASDGGAPSSGPAARVIASDDFPAGEGEGREPIKGVRKRMGQAMVQSAFSAPHVTEWVTLDATRTLDFVERLKARREFRD